MIWVQVFVFPRVCLRCLPFSQCTTTRLLENHLQALLAFDFRTDAALLRRFVSLPSGADLLAPRDLRRADLGVSGGWMWDRGRNNVA